MCMVCSTTFPKGTEHECPSDVRKRFEIDMWTQTIQRTYHGRTPRSARARAQLGPQGKQAALDLARKALPSITREQVAAIADGSIEWSEIYKWFGIEEVQP